MVALLEDSLSKSSSLQNTNERYIKGECTQCTGDCEGQDVQNNTGTGGPDLVLAPFWLWDS